LDLLKAQSIWPSASYILAPGKADLVDGLSWKWLGGQDGFEVRTLPCGLCLQDHGEKLQAVVDVELLPDALLIVVSAERLLNDQIVMENVECSNRLLWGRHKARGACGYGLRDGTRLVESAALRKHLAALARR